LGRPVRGEPGRGRSGGDFTLLRSLGIRLRESRQRRLDEEKCLGAGGAHHRPDELRHPLGGELFEPGNHHERGRVIEAGPLGRDPLGEGFGPGLRGS